MDLIKHFLSAVIIEILENHFKLNQIKRCMAFTKPGFTWIWFKEQLSHTFLYIINSLFEFIYIVSSLYYKIEDV